MKHKIGTVVKAVAVTAGRASSRIYGIDLAVEDVHAKMRQSSRKHHGL